MALFDTDGNFVKVNAAQCATSSAARRYALLGRTEHELTHPDDRQADLEAGARMLPRRDAQLAGREALHAAERPAPCGCSPPTTFVRDDHGRGVCWLGQFQDITELRPPGRGATRSPTPSTGARSITSSIALRRPARPPADARPRRLQGHQRRATATEAGDELLRVIAGATRASACAATTCSPGSVATSSPVLPPALPDGRAATRAGRRAIWPRSWPTSGSGSTGSSPGRHRLRSASRPWPSVTRPPTCWPRPTAPCTRPRPSAAAASTARSAASSPPPPRPSRPPCGR